MAAGLSGWAVGRHYGHGFDFKPGQLIHLVFHQGNKGGDDKANPLHGKSRNLEGNGLPSPGGHQGQAILSGQDRKNDLLLQGTKEIIAPGLQ